MLQHAAGFPKIRDYLMAGRTELIHTARKHSRAKIRFDVQFFGAAKPPWYTKPLNQSHFAAP